MEILPVEKWNLDRIDERTKRLIEKICEIYPYPQVNIVKEEDEAVIDEMTALELCAQTAIKESDVQCVKNKRIFKTRDKQKGYFIISSKMYPQGDKEKYWFGYRGNRLGEIEDCREQYVVLGCRNRTVVVVKFPRQFIESHLDEMNSSLDEEGNIKHYHIVLFKNPDGKITMLLSKPTLSEIDVSDYAAGEV